MKLHKKLIDIFYKSATGSRRVRTLLTPIGAFFFFTFIMLVVVISLYVDKFLKFPKVLPALLNVFVSGPISAIGLFLILWSNYHFIKVRGTPVPFNPPPKLVTTGPYAYIRNPMLSGVFILLFGVGILFNSVSLIFIFTPLFILVNILELKTVEEPELEKRLGKEYSEYKKRTHMFIPRKVNSQ
ncbi:MAG: isoprenylcysteine carboxylmethyltransferase family protein [Candidatus Firestonebacteria bacterium]